MTRRFIEVIGARQNNLKGVSVRIPIGALTWWLWRRGRDIRLSVA